MAQMDNNIPDNHPFPQQSQDCTWAPQYGEQASLINLYWNEQVVPTEKNEVPQPQVEYVGFHQFGVLPVPLVMCINGDPQWWGSLVTIWNKPWQNLLSFSRSSHRLDILTRWASSKHCSEALQQNTSLFVKCFCQILNDFISPIEHDLVRIHWFTGHESLNYTHIL